MCNICICIANPNRKDKNGRVLEEWASIPMSDEEMKAVLSSIGTEDEFDDYFIRDAETENYDIDIDPSTDLLELNELAKKIEALEAFEDEKLAAYLEWVPHLSLAEISDVIDNLGQYDFISDVCNSDDFEKYCIRQFETFDAMPKQLRYCLDVEKVGGKLEFMCHTSIGTIIRN